MNCASTAISTLQHTRGQIFLQAWRAMILDKEWLLSCTRLHDGSNVHQRLFWQRSRACLKVALTSFLASPPSALRTNRDWKGTSVPSSAFPVRLPTTCSLLFFCVFQEHLVAVVGGRALGRPTHGLQLRLSSIRIRREQHAPASVLHPSLYSTQEDPYPRCTI